MDDALVDLGHEVTYLGVRHLGFREAWDRPARGCLGTGVELCDQGRQSAVGTLRVGLPVPNG